MKFTKQEQSLIKIAAAHMAPQMVKKATLQSKLAEYGIGLPKKASQEKQAEWYNPATWFKSDSAKGKQGQNAPVSYVDNAKANGMFPFPGTANAWTDEKTRQSPLELAGRIEQKRLANQMAGRDPDQNPKLGPLLPAPDPNFDDFKQMDGTRTPYAHERWYATAQGSRLGDLHAAFPNVRFFDDALRKELEREPYTQAAVQRAREAQASELAKQVAAPGTDSYNDALEMLIQAGVNNQNQFENEGTVSTPKTGEVPAGYTGENRLNDEQMQLMRRLIPAMGDTTNARRFSNLS